MVEALEETLAPRRRRALDDHLAACASCQKEIETTERLFGALAVLPMEADVPARLEQSTLRAVRLASAEEAERKAEGTSGFRWFRVMVPAFAAAATVAVAFVATQRSTPVPSPVVAGPGAAAPGPAQVAKAASRNTPEAAPRVVAAAKPAPREGRPQIAVAAVPVELPVELSQRPDLLFALPILHNLDKLEHFEKIQTTVLDDDIGQPPGDTDSNG
jgi:hypothetical protein